MVRASEGNPLFVEEILRSLVDTGDLRAEDGQWRLFRDVSEMSIPATVHALVSARLDRLDRDEATVYERAAVVGREFTWDDVAALIDDEELATRIAAVLQSLMHKQLVRPHLGDPREEDARGHAPPCATPPTSRSPRPSGCGCTSGSATGSPRPTGAGRRLRGRGRLPPRPGLPDPAGAGARSRRVPGSWAQRAAVPLEVAGRRAFGRGDIQAAVRLLARAAELRQAGTVERLRVLPELAFSLMETGAFGRLQDAVDELDRGRDVEPGLTGHAAVLRLWMRLFTDPVGWTAVAAEETDRALASFREVGDERGLARVSSLLGVVDLLLCHYGDAQRQ